MNKQELMEILPHRDAMLLLDEADLVEGTAHGKYQFTGEEWFFQGHFPGNPIVPGVILCEIMAQSAVVLISSEASKGALHLFTGLNNVKFKRSVRPGELFETKCVLTNTKPPFYFAQGMGYVNGELCVKAEFSFALKKE